MYGPITKIVLFRFILKTNFVWQFYVLIVENCIVKLWQLCAPESNFFFISNFLCVPTSLRKCVLWALQRRKALCLAVIYSTGHVGWNLDRLRPYAFVWLEFACVNLLDKQFNVLRTEVFTSIRLSFFHECRHVLCVMTGLC
jgi:hypothetical protein